MQMLLDMHDGAEVYKYMLTLFCACKHTSQVADGNGDLQV